MARAITKLTIMQKSKRPAAKKSAGSHDAKADTIAYSLAALAADLATRKQGAAFEAKKSDFLKTIRKCLLQKKDDVLDEALELAQEADSDAHRLLRESIEEVSGIIVFRREDGRDIEVNAFVIPLFVHATGGLHREQCFQDEDAFDLLRKSFQEARLESKDATVALISHAYHPDEIERIGYSQLNEMVREAFDSMTGRKTAAKAISSSMSGWPENRFAPEDRAVELRFLLGFAVKTLDDPFYQVPGDESAADRYFEERAVRFQRWAKQCAPLVKRCLATEGGDIDIHFLYQDLFFGGKASGIAEYYTLQMLSELQHGLDAHGVRPEDARAVIGPAEAGGEEVLRANLYAEKDGRLLASFDKPIHVMRELRAEAEDAYDALTSIGVKSLALARKFDEDGQAVDVRPYEA